MIFVTVGTEKFPFERLIRSIDEAKKGGAIKEEVFIQVGHNSYRPDACRFEKFLSYNQMVSCIRTARIVVSHAGIGTTLLCLHSGKVPILFPRKAALREHLDDHQLDFARQIDHLSQALVCFECDDLHDRIANYDVYLDKLNLKTEKKEQARLVAFLRNNIESMEYC